MSALFRDAVIEARRKRLYGSLIVRTPASLGVAVWCLVLAAAVAAAYALCADYTRWEVVDGYVYPDQGAARLFAPRAGAVARVFVADGQRVKAGTPLVEISIRDLGASDDGARRDMRDLIAAQQATAQTQSMLTAQQIRNQADQRRARLSSLRSQLAGLDAQAALQRQKVQALEDMFEGLSETLDRGYISKRDYNARRAELLTERQALTELAGRRAETAAAADALALEEASSAIQQGLESGTLQRDLLRIREQAAGLKRDESFIVVAPTDGIVTGLVAKPGSAAESGTTLGYVVPEHARMEAVLLVPTRSAGFLQAGQEVRLEYEAFPYQQFGRQRATVATISRTVMPAGEQSGPLPMKEPSFRVSARLEQSTVAAYGRRTPLQVGMLLKARIATRRQRLFDWLTEPLRSAGAP
jgi:membrane fusion protein